MPSYEVRDARARRRRSRSQSSSRSSSDTTERQRGGRRVKAKKSKRRRAGADDGSVRTGALRQLGNGDHREEATAEPETETVQTVPTVTVSMPDQAPRRGTWREEIQMEGVGEADRDDDAEVAGVSTAAESDEESEVAKKLAESRARREALIAKWVNRGENLEGGGLGCPDTNTSMDAGDANVPGSGSDSDVEVKQYFEERRKQLESGDAGKSKDEEEDEDKRAVKHFIQRCKAEHDGDGDMFGFQEGDEENQDALNRTLSSALEISQTGASRHDWTDSEGYYRAQISEVMDGRYRIVENQCGKGVFSTVVKANDEQEKSAVAIKIVRYNDMMRKAAEKEVALLEKLNLADRGNRKNIIRLLRTFVYRGHFCMVFECMWDNLRVALKKYTKDKGMSLRAVRAYTKQLLIGLRHIHRCGILHADIKPDNILITAGHNLVKICDLGSAMELNEIEPTENLVSRFYRAPEIIFGGKYGPAADTFAMGATLFELFTGKILFPGRSNNDMLRMFMELKGKIPRGVIKSGTTWKQHFDENLDFKFVDKHPVTRKEIVRTVTDCSAKRSLLDLVLTRIGPEKQKSDNKEDQLYVKKAKQFADLLTQMTALDPEKRATPEDLLQHAFVSETLPAPNPKIQMA